MNHFPHPSDAVLRKIIDEASVDVRRDPNDWEAWNDIAVARLELGEVRAALDILTELNDRSPDKFEVLSNLGAVFREIGDYSQARVFTLEALKVHPSTPPLGAGRDNYYVLMLRRLQAAPPASEAPPLSNFLGFAYDRFPAMSGSLSFALDVEPYPETFLRAEHFDKIKRLIRLEPHFADGLLVLGDYLFKKRDWTQALLAYGRAKHLGHPNEAELDRRIDLVYGKLRTWVWAKPTVPPRRVEPKWIALGRMRSDLKRVEAWSREFEEIQMELHAKGASLGTLQVEDEMIRRGIERVRPREYGLRTGWLGMFVSFQGWIYWLMITPVAVIAGRCVRKGYRSVFRSA